MRMPYDPDGTVVEAGSKQCPFHQKYPEFDYSGCTCSGSWGLRKASPAERAANKKRRLEKETREAQARREFGF